MKHVSHVGEEVGNSVNNQCQ